MSFVNEHFNITFQAKKAISSYQDKTMGSVWVYLKVQKQKKNFSDNF